MSHVPTPQLSAPTAPEASGARASAIEAVEAHFRAVVEKDAAEIIARYVPREDLYVFVEGPRWSTVGHEAVATGWRAFCDAAMHVRAIDWVEGPRADARGEMAWVGGIVDLTVAFSDGAERVVRLRGTHVMERASGATPEANTGEASGEWLVAHEHFSQPAADPYGIGDWLPQSS